MSESPARPAIVTNPAEILTAIGEFRGPILPQIRHSRSRLSSLGVRVRAIRQFRDPIQPQIRHFRSRLSFLGVRAGGGGVDVELEVAAVALDGDVGPVAGGYGSGAADGAEPGVEAEVVDVRAAHCRSLRISHRAYGPSVGVE